MKAATSLLKDFQNTTRLACKIDDGESVEAFFSSIYNGCPDGRFIDQVMAAATITTGDNGVGYFINGAQLRPNRIPHVLSIFPTTGPVGTPLFVIGAHFSNSERLACSFGSVNVPARWLSIELLQCDTPVDSSVSDSVVVEVEANKDGRHTTWDGGHHFSFSPIKVFEVVPPTGPISGGTIVHILGEGFPASSDLVVRFGPTVVEATFVNASYLRCVSPPATSLASELSHEVLVVHGGAISDGALFTYFPITSVAFIEPTWGFSTHDTPIILHGVGFVNSTRLACSFESDSGVTQSLALATFVSVTRASCKVPSGMMVGDYRVRLTTNGQDLTESKANFFVLKEPSILTISPSNIPSGPSGGGTAVHLQGIDFERVSGLKCLFGSAAVDARWESSTSLWCTSPAGTSGIEHAGLIVTKDGRPYASPLFSFRYWDEDKDKGIDIDTDTASRNGRSRNVPTISAHDKTQVRDFQILNSLYGVQDVGGTSVRAGRKVSRATTPSVVRIVPDHGPNSGGTTVLVSGTDFIDSDELKCTFGSSASAGRWLSPALVACISPERSDRSVVPFGINVHGVTSTWSKSTVTFIYKERPTVDGLKPSSGPRAGGTLISITGHGFVFSSGLKARFGETLVSVVYVSPEELRCTSPPYYFAGPVEVFVDDWDKTFTDTGRELEFVYTEDLIVDGIYPTRGSMEGGLRVAVYGQGFTNITGLGCVFTRVGFVEAMFLSHEHIECETPAFSEPGPYTLEVTTNGVDFTSDGNIFTYMAPPRLFFATPDSGSIHGGTVVIVEGANFVDSEHFVCHFGTKSVPARWLSPVQGRCIAPSAGTTDTITVPLAVSFFEKPVDNGLDFLFFSPPTIHTISPTGGPVSGGNIISVFGERFWFSSDLRIRFGRTEVSATFVNSRELRCLVPRASFPGVTTLLVSFNGVEFMSHGAGMIYTYFLPTLGQGTANLSALGAKGRNSSGLSDLTPRTIAEATDSKELAPLAPFVSSIYPSTGPLFGGTVVRVRGFDFIEAQELRCMFGPKTVSAQWSSPNQVQCMSPGVQETQAVIFALEYGIRNISVSVDHKLVFVYNLGPTLLSISPGTGSRDGGTTVSVIGRDFTFSKGLRVHFGPVDVPTVFVNTSLLRCTTVAAFAQTVEISLGVPHQGTSLSYTFRESAQMIAVNSSRGTIAGGTNISFHGDRFVESDILACRFGVDLRPKRVHSGLVSAEEVSCLAPAMNEMGATLPSMVEVAINVATNMSRKIRTGSPSEAGTIDPTPALVQGRYFMQSEYSLCQFGETNMRGRRIMQTQIECTSPPPEAAADSALPGISFDDQRRIPERRTTGVPVNVKRPVNILSVTPSAGPSIGGTSVSVNGTGFIFAGIIRVRFGDSTVSCTFLSEESLSCVTPPGEAGAAQLMYDPMNDAPTYTSVSFQYYDTADFKITAGKSFCFFEKGVVRAVVGSRFFNSSNFSCRFDGMLLIRVVFSSEEEILCEVPPSHSKDLLLVEAKDDGNTFARAGDERFDCVYETKHSPLVLAPSSGPTKGGTPIVISGSAFPRTQGIECLFGEAKVVEALWLSADSVQCEAPAWEGGSREVKVSITVRGYSFGTGRGLFTYTRIMLLAALPAKGGYTGGTVVSVSGYNFDAAIQWYCWFGSQKTPAVFVNKSLLQCLSPPMIDGGAPSSVNLSVTTAGDSQDGGFQSSLSFTYTTPAEVADLNPSGGPLHAGTSVVITFKNGFGEFRPSIHCDFGEVGSSLSRWLNETSVRCVVPMAPYRGKVFLSLSSGSESRVIDKAVPFWYFPMPMVSYVHPLEVKGGTFVVTVTGGNFMGLGPVSCQLGGVLVRALWKSISVIQCPFVGVVPGVYDIKISNNMVDFVDAGVRFIVNDDGGSGTPPHQKEYTEGSPQVEVFDPKVELLSYWRWCPFWGVVDNQSEENNICMMMDNGTLMDSVPFTVCDSHVIRSNAQDYSFVHTPVAITLSPDVSSMNSALLTRNTLLGCDHVAKNIWVHVINGTCEVSYDGDGTMKASGITSSSINALLFCYPPKFLRPLLPFRQRETAVCGVFPLSFPRSGGFGVHLSGTGFRNFANGGLLCFLNGSTDPALWVSDSLVLCRVPYRDPGVMIFRIRNSDYHDLAGTDITLTETGDSRLQGYTLSPGAVDAEERSVVSIVEQFGGSDLCLFGGEVAVPVYASSDTVCATPLALVPGRVKVSFVLPYNDISTLGDSKCHECQEYPMVDGVRPLAANNFAERSSDDFSCRNNGTKISALLHPNSLKIKRSAPSRLWNGTYTVPDSGFSMISSSPPPVVTHILPAGGFAGDARSVSVFGHHFIHSQDLICLFGDRRAVHVEWVSSTQLRCISPHLPPSTVQVTVSMKGEKVNATSMTSAYYEVHYPFFISSVNASLGPVDGGTIVKVSGSYFPSTGGMDCVLGSITVSATILDQNSLECVIPTQNGNEAGFGLHYMGRTAHPQSRSTFQVKTLQPPVASEFVNSDPIALVTGANNSPKDGKKSWFRIRNLTIEAASSSAFASPPSRKSDLGMTVNAVVAATKARSDDNLDTTLTFSAMPGGVESINPTMGPESGGTEIRLRGRKVYNTSQMGCLICTMDTERACVRVPGKYVSPEELACISPRHRPGLVIVRMYHEGHHDSTSYGHDFLYFPAPHVTNIAPRAGPLEGGTMVIVSGSHLVFTGSATCRFGELSVIAAFHAKGFVCTSPQVHNLQTVSVEISVNGVDFTSDGDGNEFEYFDTRVTAVKSNYGDTRGDIPLAESADVESFCGEGDTSGEIEYEEHSCTKGKSALALSNPVTHGKGAEEPSLRSDNCFRTQMHSDIPSIQVGAMRPTSGEVSRCSRIVF